MLIATVFTACTYAACNTYFIDNAERSSDCMKNLVVHSQDFAKVWNITETPEPLQAWLDKFNIEEKATELVDYDFTCEPIHEDDIP